MIEQARDSPKNQEHTLEKDKELIQLKKEMLESKQLTIGQRTMKFAYFKKGDQPPSGYSLIFGFHGGGGCPAEVNDSQFENHKHLYDKYLPEGCIWFIPRSCQDTWDMWFPNYLEDFLIEIIQSFVSLGEVNPNKVFLTGYSAGGDGIYHMAPRMADWLAGAAMMAGHPNNVDLFNIRNIAFSLQVGAKDSAYNRNEEAKKYIEKLNQLQEKYGGFEHKSQAHEGKGHWMNKDDAKVFPWLFACSRNPYPNLILFKQHPRRNKETFYYIRVEEMKKGEEIMVFRSGNTFQIFSESAVYLRMNHSMVKMNEEVIVYHNGVLNFQGLPDEDPILMKTTLKERLDPNFVFEFELKSEPQTQEPQEERIEQLKKNLRKEE